MFRIIRATRAIYEGNEEAFWVIVALDVSIAVILVGWLVGRLVERRHLRSLRRREEELKDVTGGVKSRCIPPEEEHLSDVCVCCGKPAKHMVIWGRQY